jgi:hypothetical protein
VSVGEDVAAEIAAFWVDGGLLVHGGPPPGYLWCKVSFLNRLVVVNGRGPAQWPGLGFFAY